MFEWLINILKSTVEYHELTTKGFFSVGIFTALGTIFFTCLQGYGTWKQGSTIRQKRSGDGVSIVMILFSCCYFFAFIIYGVTKLSIVMTFNGLLGFVFLPSVFGLWRFRGFRIIEWAYLLIFFAAIPTMVFVDDKDLFLLVLLGVVICTAIPQTVEAYHAWKKGNPGSIEPKFLITFAATNFFWFIYALAIENWVLQIFNPISFINLSLALMFWWLAKKKAENKVGAI